TSTAACCEPPPIDRRFHAKPACRHACVRDPPPICRWKRRHITRRRPHRRTRSITRSTRPKTLPKRLSREEAAALLAQPNRRYPTGIRDRALMRLMYRAGLRCAETLALRPRDVVLARHEIRVNQGKGSKDRVVWIDETTVEVLARWRDVRPASDWF